MLVITHDDRYFHLADRIIKLDYGQVQTQRVGSQPPFGEIVDGEVARVRESVVDGVVADGKGLRAVV